jgi:molybdate transport system ATP-binding protein
MDEPLASLDERRKQELLPFLTRLHQTLDIPVLYVTHSQQEVAQLADYLVVLAAGKVHAAGPLAHTLSRLDVSLAHDREAASVWHMTVADHDSSYYLSRVSCDLHAISLPLLSVPVGTSVRVLIKARDVSLTLHPPTATSILNVLPATISGMVAAAHGQVVVQLQVGRQSLLAHITQKSADSLGLHSGMAVFAQIKGSSLIH